MARTSGNKRNAAMMMQKPKDMKKTLGRLVKFILGFKKMFIPLVIVVIFYTVLNVSSNVIVEKLVAALGSFDLNLKVWKLIPNKEEFIKYLIIFTAAMILYVLCRLFSDLIGAKLSTSITKVLRKQSFDKLVKLPIRYTDTHPHGDIMSRIVNDVDSVSNAVSNTAVSLIGGILQIIGCFLVMLYFSPLLTLICFGVLILTFVSTMTIGKLTKPLFKKQQALLGQLNSETEEMVTGSKTVIAYNRQEIAKIDFAKKSEALTKVGTKAQIISGSMGPVMNCLGNIGYYLVCLFGAIFIVNGIGGTITGQVLTASIVITFLRAVKQFTRPINEIAQLYAQIVSAVAAAERVFEVIDEQEEDFSKKIDFDPSMVKGIIDFDHIKFEYKENHLIIKDFDVDIWSGHKIALVGATGSGKTTMVNLLLRFYDVKEGNITIDGININDISKKDLRSCISIVLQDPVLFQDSVENNVRYGRENATDEEVDAALEFANCKKFVGKLPEGKRTILTEGATNISQGQRQLLTIARAVLADPKILILDEATSSVDTRTEKKIQDAMIRLMENRTSIIIAHRLSTIQDADLIIVMDDGHIVEMGNHNELLKKDGVYNKLYQTQFAGNEI